MNVIGICHHELSRPSHYKKIAEHHSVVQPTHPSNIKQSPPAFPQAWILFPEVANRTIDVNSLYTYGQLASGQIRHFGFFVPAAVAMDTPTEITVIITSDEGFY